MALTVKDRVKESSTTTGTADFVLGGAAAGFQTFAVIGNTNTTYYAAVDQATGDWEVGVGTYSSTGPTLTRDTVLESSNSGSKVNFAAGSKDVFCTYPAERSVYLDAAGSAVSVLDIGTLGASTANITTANITAGTVTTTPTSGNDITNKTYVDTLVASGIHFHQPVRVESPINLNAAYNNGSSGVGATLTNAGTQVALVIDGITVATNDRVLVYQQTTATQNGIYVVTNTGSGATNWVLTRASDANTYVINSAAGLSEGSTVFVQQGVTGAGETYTCNTSGVITFGTTNITFAQISSAQIYSAGTGLTLSGTQFSVTNTGTAGTYGGAGTVPIITTNAQGQVTSVTPTAIAIAAAAVSGLAPSATTDTTNAANITSGTLPVARLNGSYTGITGVGTLAVGTWNGGTIAAAYGGTGQSSYAVGDILYAGTTTSLTKLAGVATGNALISGGVGTAPAWGKIGLQTHISGTLQIVNGGTGATDAATARANLGAGTGNGSVTSVAAGSYLTGGTITTTGTLAVDATTTNTAGKVVARDGSGNFSAGTVTANLTGNVTGNVTGTASGNLPLSGGTLTGNLLFGNASSPNSNYIQFGDNTGWVLRFMTNVSGTPTERFRFTDGGAFNTVGAITQNGSQVLTAGNYTSYAPSLTGSGASGTWGINITGNSASVAGLVPAQFYNNMGNNHSTYTNFNSVPGFGCYYLQQGNNGPTGVSSSQWYGFTVGLGNEYPLSQYGSQIYWPRRAQTADTYVYVRDMEGSSWTSWTKIKAGYADSAGSVGSISATTSTGIQSSFVTTINTTTPGLTTYGIAFSGSSAADNAQGITWGWNNASAQAGIYVQSSGAYGTKMYFGTTDSFATGSKTSMSIDHNGVIQVPRSYLQSDSSLRAPIFYDSNNTGYYVDPASTSYLYNLTLAGGGYFQPNNWIQFNGSYGLYWPNNYGAHLHANDLSTYTQIALRGGKNSYGGIYDQFSAVNIGMYDSGGNGGVYREANGRWFSYYHVGNDCMGIGTSSTSSTYSLYLNKGVYAQSRIDATIFYDSNDTGYYLDPNSTSDSALRIRGGALHGPNPTWGQYLAVGTNGNTNTGYASVCTTDGNLHLDAKVGSSMYLNYYAGSNVYFGNGGSGGIFAQVASDGSFRSPVFYDYNNTGYYLDPTGSTSMRTSGDWRADSISWTGEFSGKIQYHSSIWYFQAATGHQFRNSGGAQTLFVDSSGNLTANGNVTAYSDVRVKENIVTIDAALDKVLNLRGVYYNKIGNPERRVGVVAQEIEAVLPEVVRSVVTTDPSTGQTTELLAVDYGNITGLLIEAVKQLSAKVDELQKRV